MLIGKDRIVARREACMSISNFRLNSTTMHSLQQEDIRESRRFFRNTSRETSNYLNLEVSGICSINYISQDIELHYLKTKNTIKTTRNETEQESIITCSN